ncbi:sugar phosphate nucleotidyltransferase [Shewanella mangrovisoli]|uniref:sugar phosphate nucleotidyltransferase n=1 Tax=Shewanella mangrovisoli TaxID=2864211 RepID=UPI00370A7F29
MQAIIFANRHGHELAPLDKQYCPALLPMGNRALIEYTLEDVANAGIVEVKLIISSHAKELEAHLGDGSRWGLKIDYFLSREQESVNCVMSRLKLDFEQDYLVVRGDMLRSPCIKRFIDYSLKRPLHLVLPIMADCNPGMLLLPSACNHLYLLDWPLERDPTVTNAMMEALPGQCALLDSFESYLNVNLAIGDGSFTGLSPSGRPTPSGRHAKFFHLGAKAQTGKLDQHTAWGAIGEQTWIAPDVDMHEQLIIGDQCVIEKNCRLSNSVILTNSFVGEGLNVDNCIISKNLLINVGFNTAIEVDDPRLIASTEQNLHAHVPWSSRLIALILLGLSLSFWPLLWLWSLCHSSTLGQSRPALSIAHQPIKLWRVNLPPSGMGLALLPQLYQVCLGRLFLLGSQSPEMHSTSVLSEATPLYGVYGPLQLLGAELPEEEQGLIEQEFLSKPKASQCYQVIKLCFQLVSKSVASTGSATAKQPSTNQLSASQPDIANEWGNGQ